MATHWRRPCLFSVETLLYLTMPPGRDINIAPPEPHVPVGHPRSWTSVLIPTCIPEMRTLHIQSCSPHLGFHFLQGLFPYFCDHFYVLNNFESTFSILVFSLYLKQCIASYKGISTCDTKPHLTPEESWDLETEMTSDLRSRFSICIFSSLFWLRFKTPLTATNWKA